jgi:hypothetical protein
VVQRGFQLAFKSEGSPGLPAVAEARQEMREAREAERAESALGWAAHRRAVARERAGLPLPGAGAVTPGGRGSSRAGPLAGTAEGV